MNASASAAEEKSFVKAESDRIQNLKTIEDVAAFIEARIDQPYYAPVGFSNIPNQDQPDVFDGFIIPQAKTLPERSYYADEKVTADYLKVLELFFKTIGVKGHAAAAKDVLDFETKFSAVYPLPAEIRDRISQKMNMTKEDLIAKYPRLKLSRFLTRVPANVAIRNIAPEAMSFLNDRLEASQLRQIKNVLLFHTLRRSLDDAYPEYCKKAFEFNAKHLGGPSQRPDRKERCTKLASSVFDKEFDEEMIEILFPGFDASKVEDLVGKVRGSISTALGATTWLSPEAKAEAIRKITMASLSLVKPKTVEDWDFMPDFDVSETTPYANLRSSDKAGFEKELAELSKPRSRTRWSMGPLTLNAYYSPSDNKFVLLQGILQSPFYDQKAVEIQNLGAIGVVVGHELGHAIDDKGSKYDAEGKLRGWMSDKDRETFKLRSQGLISQFDKIGHNGAFTLGENIGDHVGLFAAYNAAVAAHPNLTTGDKKDFFTAYARVWCEVQTPSAAKQRLKTDPHALGRERINQQVVHNPGFYEAFGCKEGQKMYLPEKDRVRVW